VNGFRHSKCHEAQISTFKAYIERQVAANHAFVDKLLHAKNFQFGEIESAEKRATGNQLPDA
jgi:hypothetical protein